MFKYNYYFKNIQCYKHKYFLALFDDSGKQDDYLTKYQRGEVSKIEWKNISECINSIRPYNLEKKRLINIINKILINYKIL